MDFLHVLAGGKIIKTGGPELIDEIGGCGFHSLEAGEARLVSEKLQKTKSKML